MSQPRPQGTAGTLQFPKPLSFFQCTVCEEFPPSLKLCMFATQGLWQEVETLYLNTNVRLSEHDRDFALSKAAERMQWSSVMKMAFHPATSSQSVYRIFSQAVQQGHWHAAVSLSLASPSVQDNVMAKLTALRTWLSRGRWECVDSVLSQWTRHEHASLILTCLLKECIKADKSQVCKKILDWIAASANRRSMFDCAVQRLQLIRTAIVEDRKECVFHLLSASPGLYMKVLKFAAALLKWDVIERLLTSEELISNSYDHYNLYLNNDYGFYYVVFNIVLRCLVRHPASWQAVVPFADKILNKLRGITFEVAPYLDFEGFRRATDSGGGRALFDFCAKESRSQLAFFMAVATGCEESLTQVMQRRAAIHQGTVLFSFYFALRVFKYDTAAKCLPSLSVHVITRSRPADTSPLVEVCRNLGMYAWAALFGAWSRKWDDVRLDLQLYRDQSALIYASDNVSDAELALLHRSSESQLAIVMHSALAGGQVDCCRTVMDMVDARLKVFDDSWAQRLSLLQHVFLLEGARREQLLKVCIQAGLSTHEPVCPCTYPADMCTRCQYSPMWQALRSGETNLVKLLYHSGACSNKDLFRFSQDDGLKGCLARRGRQDTVDFLTAVATNPCSLQSLCSQRVSHLLGCHPGRQKRAQAMGIIWPAKGEVSFVETPPPLSKSSRANGKRGVIEGSESQPQKHPRLDGAC